MLILCREVDRYGGRPPAYYIVTKDVTDVVLPPRQKLVNIQKPHGEAARILTRPFKAGEKAEEYFFIAMGSLSYNYKIKEQE